MYQGSELLMWTRLPKYTTERRYTRPVRHVVVIALFVLAASTPIYYIRARQGSASQDILVPLQRAISQAKKEFADEDSRAYRTDLPLARLQLKKARLATQQYAGHRADSYIQAGWAALTRLTKGKPTEAGPGRLTELAYQAHNDGSVQPYHLYLPPDYDPDTSWPLIVFLHGYVPSITVLDPWLPSPEICKVAGDNGCMLLVPYGRRNTDFQGIGEVDVLRALREVQGLYHVDADRVYVSGVSMGGMGAWNILLRHPGLFAAAAPISGHTDMFRWWGWSRTQVPGFKQWLVAWDNPLGLLMNLRNQPAFAQHGELDRLIPVEQSRLIVAAGQRRGLPVEYYEFKGQGHYIYWDLECYQKAWSWLVKHTLDASPRRVSFKTYSLEYNQAFWVTVEDFERWGLPAEVDAQVSLSGDSLRVRTNNISRLTIDVRTAPLEPQADFDLTVNGQKTIGRATTNGELCLHTAADPGGDERTALRKRPGLCGPVEEAFDTPFIVVQGTAGNETQNAQLASSVQRWVEEWGAFGDGRPRITTDEALTHEQIAAYNLVLFGTPQTNRILARAAPELPIAIGDHRYQVGNTLYEGQGLGLIMCYPSPLAPERYLLIYSGEYYGDRLPPNHKFDLLPDFIIFGADSYDYDEANRYICAGFFDMNWQLQESLTWCQGLSQ